MSLYMLKYDKLYTPTKYERFKTFCKPHIVSAFVLLNYCSTLSNYYTIHSQEMILKQILYDQNCVEIMFCGISALIKKVSAT